jgi:hypothetical protein
MISRSSSSLPQTLRHPFDVTFFDAQSTGLGQPKDKASLLPLCICLMKKIQKPSGKRNGARDNAQPAAVVLLFPVI